MFNGGGVSTFTETMGFLIAAKSSNFLPKIKWVRDEDSNMTKDEFEHHFGPLGDEPVDEILEWREQVTLRSSL